MYEKTQSKAEYRKYIREKGPLANWRRKKIPDGEDKEKPRKSAWHYLNRFMREFRDIRGKIVLALLMTGVSILVEAAFPWAGKLMIDTILPKKDINLLLIACSALLLVAVFRVVASWLAGYLVDRISGNITVAIKRKLMRHLQILPLIRIQELKVGGIISRIQQDTESMAQLLRIGVIRSFNAAMMFSVALFSMLTISGLVTAVCLCCSALMFGIAYIFFNVMRPFQRTLREENATISAGLSEIFSGIQVVRSFGREPMVKRDFGVSINTLWRKNLYASVVGSLVERSFWMMFFVWQVAIWLFGGYSVIKGTMTVGEVVVFLTFVDWMFRPIFMIVDSLSNLQTAVACTERALDLLDEQPDIVNAPDAGTVTELKHSIEFDHVTFDYPNGTRALEDVTLSIPRGKVTALVGPSGGGKTTLTNLVLRFYDVTTGEIRLDGVDIRTIRLQDYRKLMSLVLQDVYLFDGTIRDNIRFGKTEATDTEIEQAAAAAHCHEFITALEKQYDTVIGERGVKLSGGQKQRIALARALVADPQLLILDEATSNLDSESEGLIQDALKKIFTSRTSLVIAHRLSTIMDADNIIVIADGQVAEQGTQEELLSRRGKYFEMYSRQMEKAEISRNYWLSAEGS